MHDFFLFWWELIALNARKSLFRMRGGPPPCQSQMDSGRAFETHCEACTQWNKQGRFRRVCPALAWTPGGWRCSLNAADVRPLWGRAIAYYAGTLTLAYLVLTLGAFAVLRGVGYGFRYVDVAWPPAWRHFDAIRSKYYFAQGRAAVADHRIGEATLSLSLAYELDPANYEAGLALAQLWQAGQTTGSDLVYTRLLASHPVEAARTAGAWGQALVWRGDFAQLAKLATERLGREPPPATVWQHALIFSARRLENPAPLVAALALPNLPGETRALLRLESAALAGNGPATAQILAAPLTEDASAYARFYQVQFLIDAGAAQRAVELLAQYGARLPADERVILSLAALARLGQSEQLRREAEALLRANPKPQIYEILAAHLVRHPDPELLRRVCGQFATMPWANDPAGTAATAALLCAAGVNRDRALLATLRTQLRKTTGTQALALNRAEEIFIEQPGRRTLGGFLPTLPMLPIEVVYALFERNAAEARNLRQP